MTHTRKMRITEADVEKEVAVQTTPKRGRLVKAAETKGQSAAAGDVPQSLLELRATVHRALRQIEAAIKKYVGSGGGA